MDRLNDNGVIALITNRSFIDARAFDGFRKTIQTEFDHCYIIDTKSDVRVNPKIAGTTHNVFGIQTGVAVMFLVKSSHKQIKSTSCKINYVSMDDFLKKEEKLAWFIEQNIENIDFENITPDKGNNWVNLSENNWDDLVAVVDKETKSGRKEEAIFRLFSNGIKTQKDEWSMDWSNDNLKEKIKYFIGIYQKTLANKDYNEKCNIKWDDDLEAILKRGIVKEFESEKIINNSYRPFMKKWFYFDKQFIARTYTWNNLYSQKEENNIFIAFHSLSGDQLC